MRSKLRRIAMAVQLGVVPVVVALWCEVRIQVKGLDKKKYSGNLAI